MQAQVQEKEIQAALVTQFWSAPDGARFDQRTISLVVGYGESTLEKRRSIGGGPRFIRLGGVFAEDRNGRRKLFGGKVLYVKRDVVAWMNGQEPVDNTSQVRLPGTA